MNKNFHFFHVDFEYFVMNENIKKKILTYFQRNWNERKKILTEFEYYERMETYF